MKTVLSPFNLCLWKAWDEYIVIIFEDMTGLGIDELSDSFNGKVVWVNQVV